MKFFCFHLYSLHFTHGIMQYFQYNLVFILFFEFQSVYQIAGKWNHEVSIRICQNNWWRRTFCPHFIFSRFRFLIHANAIFKLFFKVYSINPVKMHVSCSTCVAGGCIVNIHVIQNAHIIKSVNILNCVKHIEKKK